MKQGMLTQTQYDLLKEIAGLDGIPAGAYNIRANGQAAGRHSTEKIEITPKTDHPGIDIRIQPGVKGETVYIPVVMTESGMNDVVYNDFYIGEGADVNIVAGCGIHNDGCSDSEHDGIHRFFIGKGAHIKYVENHYGAGAGTGARILNPTTEVYMEEDSSCEMEMTQIRGVNSTVRETTARLDARAKLLITEKLMTHGDQKAHSDVTVDLNGGDASARIISRAVARDQSEQVFCMRANGNARCRAHIQCDAIIMDHTTVRSIPEITASCADAQLVHEAAIGRINNDQMMKLCTLGLSEEEAENVIIEGFLK